MIFHAGTQDHALPAGRVSLAFDGADRGEAPCFLQGTPAASSITLQQAALRRFRHALAQNAGIMNGASAAPAVSIAFDR